MKQWLEISIKINDFTYAVREEVDNIYEIKDKGIEITNRLYDLVNKREKKSLKDNPDFVQSTNYYIPPTPFMCKVKPGAEYYVTDKSKGPYTFPEHEKDEIFKSVYHIYDEYLVLKNRGWYDILVKKEDVLPQMIWNWKD